MKLERLLPLLYLAYVVTPCFAQTTSPAEPNVTRATLANGMHVVIIPNKLAPVVTVQANFMVGGNETPDGFPGHGACPGAHGVPRLRGNDGRPDGSHLRAAGRRK